VPSELIAGVGILFDPPGQWITRLKKKKKKNRWAGGPARTIIPRSISADTDGMLAGKNQYEAHKKKAAQITGLFLPRLA
jgi:hypothetical protein